MTRDEMMEEMIRRSEEQAPIIERLVAEGMHPITAHIVSGDILSAQRAAKEIEAGVPAERAIHMVGSYARWDFALQCMVSGSISEQWFADHVCELWQGSDPDDTRIEYLRLWQRLRARNGGLLRDGRPLPKGGANGWLRVYRGGPPKGLANGIAWTTDPKVARRFAAGAGSRVQLVGGVVIAGYVKPSNVLAFITGRNESEVIVAPSDIKNLSTVKGPAK